MQPGGRAWPPRTAFALLRRRGGLRFLSKLLSDIRHWLLLLLLLKLPPCFQLLHDRAHTRQPITWLAIEGGASMTRAAGHARMLACCKWLMASRL